MPAGARVVHVGKQAEYGLLYLWAEVNPAAETVERRFDVIGTGIPIPAGATHVHTWQDGPFIWHLVELGQPS